MRRLRFLLRPGWIILALLVGVFAYLCFTVLAPWQFGRDSETEERNHLIEASLDADPVPVGEVLGATGPAADDAWRRVTLTGSYVPDQDVLLRLRPNDGSPSFEVLTPFRLTDGTHVLVDRGFVKAVDGTKPPADIDAAPSGELTLTGRIQLPEAVADKAPITQDGYRQVYSIAPQQLSDIMGVPLSGAYVQLADDQPGGFNAIALPQLDAGPYFSYALQWLAFGIMAPLGLAYFVRAELLERRKSREPAPTPAEESPAAPVTVADKLADRYGTRR